MTDSAAALKEPMALSNLREKSAAAFSKLDGVPKDSESWRKIDVSRISLKDYHPFQSDSGITCRYSAVSAEGVYTDARLPDTVKILSYAEAFEDPLLSRVITTAVDESLKRDFKNLFKLANQAWFAAGIVVQVRGEHQGELRITHRLNSGDSMFHRVLIMMEPDAEISITEEYFTPAQEKPALVIPVTNILLGNESRLKYVSVRNYDESEYHFHNTDSRIGRGAVLKSYVVHQGGLLGKEFHRTSLMDSRTEYIYRGVSIAAGREIHDKEMLVEHTASDSRSSILHKTVATGRSHSIFNGNLHIPQGLKNIDALQVNHNIILSKKARAESMPNLVTKSDSVSCEHGATVGRLDDDAVFFLMARGLPEREARRLPVSGFFEEIIREIPLSEEMKETIIENIHKRIQD